MNAEHRKKLREEIRAIVADKPTWLKLEQTPGAKPACVVLRTEKKPSKHARIDDPCDAGDRLWQAVETALKLNGYERDTAEKTDGLESRTKQKRDVIYFEYSPRGD